MKINDKQKNADIRDVRLYMDCLGSKRTIINFDEHIQLDSVIDSLKVWREDGQVIGFGYVDDYANLWFESESDGLSPNLNSEIIEWGAQVLRARNRSSGSDNTLDHACVAENLKRQQVLLKNDFALQPIRSLSYRRVLSAPITSYQFPAGFTWRPVNNNDPVESLVELHRAAFGTMNMTVEYRQAMIDSPAYQQELDLLAIAPDGSLAAFCLCGFEGNQRITGYTDPIGTRPVYQHMGLAKALVSVGFSLLERMGAKFVELGTSSENTVMQKLATSLGFNCISEKLWFSKTIVP